MIRRQGLRIVVVEVAAIVTSIVVFIIPFYFMILNSLKTSKEAAEMNLKWPETFHIVDNLQTVLLAQNYTLLRAFFNSTAITVLSIVILVVACSMAGFVMQRRTGKILTIVSFLVLAGLMIPPAIVPTIWVLDGIGLFKTMTGMILVEVALSIPFAIILYTGFVATIPREMDEAALVDGSGGFRFFFSIVLPLLKPVSATVVVLSAVNIFNDFVNPLYFFPGAKNVTVQLTLYNFMSLYNTSWNLLFANVILITIPPFVLFIFFNKRIVAGMTAGAVKG